MTSSVSDEELMYSVMTAIYESGIPVDFKGAMVLRACLSGSSLFKEMRHTFDIDANWNSETAPTETQMMDSFSYALKKNGINLVVKLRRQYGQGRSAGFIFLNPKNGEIMFSMDVDVGRPIQSTNIYSVNGLRFRGISPIQMLADKISVVSSDKIFRRIKDVIDLFFLSQVFEFDENELKTAIERNDRTLGDFNGFLNRPDELRHAYDRFRPHGVMDKPDFEDVYSSVKSYIRDLLPSIERDQDDQER